MNTPVDPHAPGTHLLVDFYGADRLTEAAFLKAAITDAAIVAGASVLQCQMHEFGGSGGVTGVALLAESHISIHTWPERDYAAIDVFMCGAAQPMKAVDFLQNALNPESTKITSVQRGQRNQ